MEERGLGMGVMTGTNTVGADREVAVQELNRALYGVMEEAED